MYDEGRIVPGIGCPRCGSDILYNGNYFCEQARFSDPGDRACNWINPAVFGGNFTVADADFADRLIEALTGKPSKQNLQGFARDAS